MCVCVCGEGEVCERGGWGMGVCDGKCTDGGGDRVCACGEGEVCLCEGVEGVRGHVRMVTDSKSAPRRSLVE